MSVGPDVDLGALPRWPLLLGQTLRESDRLIITLRSARREVEITALPEELARISRALWRCDGSVDIDTIVGLPADRLTVGAIEALVNEGLVVDVHSQARHLLARMHGRGRLPPTELADVMASQRWIDQRSIVEGDVPLSTHRRAPQRHGSVALKQRSARPVSPVSVLEVLACSYGSDGRAKPVPSAGRLWPLAIHTVGPTVTRKPLADQVVEYVDVAWFDDAAACLRHTGVQVSVDRAASWYFQRDQVRSLLAEGGLLVIISADLSRSERKYGNRSAQYSLIECGCVLARIVERSEAAGIATCPIGGFDPPAVRNDVLARDLEPLLSVALATKAQGGIVP